MFLKDFNKKKKSYQKMTIIKKNNVLLYTTVGDALGTPLDGLSKGHISSVFKKIEGYIDPLLALKGKTEKWRKPGLYSATSQLSILFALNMYKGAFSVHKYIDLIANSPDLPNSISGIFRYPDNVVKDFIISCHNNGSASMQPSATLPLITFPLVLHEKSDYIPFICTFANHMSRDIMTIAGCAIYADIMSNFIRTNNISSKDMLHAAIENAKSTVLQTERESSVIFESGINPESLISAMKVYVSSLESVAEGTNEEREKRLLAIVNTVLKTPATRLTIPHPLAIIPYSLYLVYKHRGIPESIFSIAEEGGACGALTACSSSFLGILNEAEDIPSTLIDGLVNRKRILSIIKSISEQKVLPSLIDEFINSELSLSIKAFEELKARTKTRSTPAKTAKPLSNEQQLARHVVESWTKLDKAKWKKERRRNEQA